jgi:AAA+ ATPase superfamily predicted ATPase
MTPYRFPDHESFRDRSAELDRLRRWWEDASDPFPLVVYGRRRTGKTWLLREFAHGRDADILVCDSRAEGDQLAYFARVLEGSVGVRPEIADIRSFYEILFRQGTSRRRLAVIDEFPMLLAAGSAADSSLAAALAEMATSSLLKLVVCGSQISTMETLLAERAPLHGRGTSLLVRPLRFDEALAFLPTLPPGDLITRYAIAGGMPLYLRRLGRRGSLKAIVCEDMLSPLGPFFDEVRDVLSMELTSTATHFSLISALAGAPSLAWDELVARSRVEESVASRYIKTLEDLHIVRAANPLFAPPQARRRRYRLADPFMRFWFRFVFPHQSELAAGMSLDDHYERGIEPFLTEHVAPTFEDICRAWVRKSYAGATDVVGPWWGLARHDLRRRKLRSTEEIDVVGARGSQVTVVGECRWRRGPMPRQVLADLRRYKLPALAQTGVDVSSARVVLFSHGGFGQGLVQEAREGSVALVDASRLVADLAS